MQESQFELLGQSLHSPLINGEGSINGPIKDEILRNVALLARTGIGAITVGSITLPRQIGNEARFGGPTYHHDALTGLTYNSMGMPNIGLAEALLLLPEILAIAHEQGKPVFLSLSPTIANADIGDAFAQTKVLISEGLDTQVDGLILNSCCPNLIDEDGNNEPLLGYDLAGMLRLAFELSPIVGTDHRVGLKLPPYITPQQRSIVPAMAAMIKSSNAFSFIVTSNTIPNQMAKDEQGRPILSVPGGAGGMSGPGTLDIGREQLQMWSNLLQGDKEIISMLGINSGEELLYRINNGASAAGGVTFLWESNNWGQAVSKILQQFIEAYEP